MCAVFHHCRCLVQFFIVSAIAMAICFVDRLLARRQSLPSCNGSGGPHTLAKKCRRTQPTAACGARSKMGFRKPAAARSAKGKTLKSWGKVGASSSIAKGRVLGDVRTKPTYGSSKMQMVKKKQHVAASGAHRWMNRREHVEGNDCSKKLMGGLQRPVAPAAISGHLSEKDADLRAGDAQETDAEHSRRHPPQHLCRWASTCARCAYQLWLRKRACPPQWLRPKPKFMGGAWGLGCTYCAAGRYSEAVQQRRQCTLRWNKQNRFCKQAVPRASKWSQYGVKRLLTCKRFTWFINQHASTDGHRMAVGVFHGPAFHLAASGAGFSNYASRTTDTQPHAEIIANTSVTANLKAHPQVLEKSLDVTGMPALDLFRGRVPQVKDWLDVWADSSSAISVQGCQYHYQFRCLPPFYVFGSCRVS